MTTTWTNWSKLVTARPRSVVRPWTLPALQRTVQAAIHDGRRIKAIGSGHSFTDIAAADDVQLDLSKYSGIVALDLARQQVTLRSGTKLWQLPELLADTGLALQNLGDITHQSIAGAISTSTHGTGLAFGGLASQVVGIELLTGTGETLTVSATQNAELLDALRVTLGAYGIITSITLQLVCEYDLHTVENRQSLSSIIQNWHGHNTRNDHFEFFWFGHDDHVLAKTSQRIPVQNRSDAARTPLSSRLLDEVITNGGLSVVCHLGRMQPSWVPWLNRTATRAWGSADRRAHWSKAFNSSRRVRFNEMEYALPFDDIPEIITELRTLFRRGQLSSTFPLEVRAAAPDTAWLASNHGRRTGYIAVHQHFAQDHREYFGRIEPIFKAAGGRPHWGKLHTLDADDLAGLYPHWADNIALRDQLDPQRLFSNHYLTRIMGA